MEILENYNLIIGHNPNLKSRTSKLKQTLYLIIRYTIHSHHSSLYIFLTRIIS